jgi:ABC-2 type transport system ATP-binding protein
LNEILSQKYPFSGWMNYRHRIFALFFIVGCEALKKTICQLTFSLEREKEKNGNDCTLPVIETIDLKKSYGSLQAVKGISFEVRSGEIFSMLGPNGAGKTTTIEILEGLRAKDSGEVSVLGLDPWKNGYELHKKIGVIPQGFRFFDKATPKEAIKYYADLFGVKADPEQIIREVILQDAENTYFENLSGGQKQKVGLALSLVNNPELLFLDEPTTGLDPQARRAVWQVIKNLKKAGRSILLTTHYLEEAEQLADRVAIMDHGLIIASGSPYEIEQKFGSQERIKVVGSRELADFIKTNSNFNVRYNDTTREIEVAIQSKNDALTTFKLIEQSGLDWRDLSTERDNLEDIFLRLVSSADEAADTFHAS